MCAYKHIRIRKNEELVLPYVRCEQFVRLKKYLSIREEVTQLHKKIDFG